MTAVVGVMVLQRQRRGRGVEPDFCLLIEMRSDRVTDAIMIVVEPAQLFAGEHVQIDQPAVDRRQGQRLEGVDQLLGAGNLGADNQFKASSPATGSRLHRAR